MNDIKGPPDAEDMSSLNTFANYPVKSPGDIAFTVGGEPIIELRSNGNILIRGKLITNDLDVVDGLREIIGLARVSKIMSE